MKRTDGFCDDGLTKAENRSQHNLLKPQILTMLLMELEYFSTIALFLASSGVPTSLRISPLAVLSMKDFFISYNNRDREWAEWIAALLENAGLTTILQVWDFRPGSNFILEIAFPGQRPFMAPD